MNEENKSSKRFSLSQFDLETWVIVDNINHNEYCVCGTYDEQVIPAEARAQNIARCLNEKWEQIQTDAIRKRVDATLEMLKLDLENFKKEQASQAYWGICPSCGNVPGHILNVAKNHFAVCHNCKTYWAIGYNLFSNWQDEDEAVWEMNKNLLKSYHQAEAIYNTHFFESDICPRCGAGSQVTHHFLCQSKDGTPTPYSDDEVKTMIRGLNLGLRHYGIRNPGLDDDQIEF